MAQKDIAEKILADYNDVFADIVNGLLFDGEQKVKEDELTDAHVVSQYKADGSKLHEQERDVAKIWSRIGIQIAFIGLENQTRSDSFMPLRVIGYDGASYRAQLLKNEVRPHPVITLVLHFGNERWSVGRSLYDCLDVPEYLRPFVSDYRINVFEIAWLEPEQVARFKSDFRIVADFFVQQRLNKEYKPGREIVKHVDEVLKLLEILSQDKRFGEIDITRLKTQDDNGGLTMCEVLDKVENRGIEKGIKEGIKKGTENMIIAFDKQGVPLETIAAAAGMSIEQVEEIISRAAVTA